jgi:hypothetical protein
VRSVSPIPPTLQGDKSMTTDLSDVKYRFFDMAVADIIRAIRGKSLMGAFTLSMCAIDAMAYLRNALPSKRSAENFRKWVEDWMVPLNGNCRPDVLYALRCGLVHTYGYAEAMQRCGLLGYEYVQNQPQDHWGQPAANRYVLNLETHVAEVTVAAFKFFDDLALLCAQDSTLDEEVGRRAGLLTIIHKYEAEYQGPGRLLVRHQIVTPRIYADMEPALAPFDEGVEDLLAAIESSIRGIYSQT